MTMRHLEIRADVPEVDVVTLLEKPEGERSFFVDH